jgi:hypothetical protein
MQTQIPPLISANSVVKYVSVTSEAKRSKAK